MKKIILLIIFYLSLAHGKYPEIVNEVSNDYTAHSIISSGESIPSLVRPPRRNIT